jgi:Amt family ammonium transporter
MGALLIGLVAGALCPLAISLKYRLGYDDSLDVVGVHLVGGVLGTLLIGLVATDAAPNGRAGLFYGGGWELLGVQAIAAAAVLGYSFVVTLVIAKVLDLTMGLRLPAEAEQAGADISVHAEVAYNLDGKAYSTVGAATPQSVVASAEQLIEESAPLT